MATLTHVTPDELERGEGVRARVVPMGRKLAVTGLLLGGLGNTLQATLAQFVPERPDTVAERIGWASENAGAALTMSLAGTLAVPFMAIGFVAAAHLLRHRARRTANVATTLLLIGMCGFLVIQVAELFELRAMLDPAGHEAAVFLNSLESDPVTGPLFGAMFMVGAPLGVLVLTIGALVKGGMPRWIAGAWLAFILLDFSIGDIGPVDPHWLYLLGCVALSVHVGRLGAREWANG